MNQQGMSGAGILVVGTLCFGLLMTLATACALVLRGMEVPTQLEAIIGPLLVGVPALLARTWSDRNKGPTEVVGQAGEPVVVEEAAPPS